MAKTTRRRFLQATAASGALPLVAHAVQEESASADQALLSVVRMRFKHLNEDQLKAVQRGLRGDLAAAEVLKRVRLDLADEPATVFVADLAA